MSKKSWKRKAKELTQRLWLAETELLRISTIPKDSLLWRKLREDEAKKALLKIVERLEQESAKDAKE